MIISNNVLEKIVLDEHRVEGAQYYPWGLMWRVHSIILGVWCGGYTVLSLGFDVEGTQHYPWGLMWRVHVIILDVWCGGYTVLSLGFDVEGTQHYPWGLMWRVHRTILGVWCGGCTVLSLGFDVEGKHYYPWGLMWRVHSIILGVWYQTPYFLHLSYSFISWLAASLCCLSYLIISILVRTNVIISNHTVNVWYALHIT